MCEKNHYGRKVATILLALLTALLVLSFMTGSRALAAVRITSTLQALSVSAVPSAGVSNHPSATAHSEHRQC